MSRRLKRRDLRRRSGAGARLAVRSLARRGVWRQAVIGAAGGLACAGGVSVAAAAGRLSDAWTEIVGRVLIVVPDPPDIAAVLSAAGPGAKRIDPGRIASLLGGATELAPTLVLATSRDPGLAARIEAIAPGSIVEADGGAPAGRLAVFGHRIAFASKLLLAAIGLAWMATLAIAARHGVLASVQAARLLRQLGATDGWIIRHLVWPPAAAAAVGGTVGSANVVGIWSLAFAFAAGLGTAVCARVVAHRRIGMQW